MKTLLGMFVSGSAMATARVVAVTVASAIVVMAMVGMGALEARGDLLAPGGLEGGPPRPKAPLEATGIRVPVRVVQLGDNLPKQVDYRIMISRKLLEKAMKSKKGVIVLPSNGTVESEPRGGAPFLGTVIAAVLLAAAIAIAPFAWRRRRPIGKRAWGAGVAGSLLFALALTGLVSYLSGGAQALADIGFPRRQPEQFMQIEVVDNGDDVILFTR
jgi:hypothetical protein